MSMCVLVLQMKGALGRMGLKTKRSSKKEKRNGEYGDRGEVVVPLE